MRRFVLLVGIMVAFGLLAGSAGAKGASAPTCSADPTSVPVRGSTTLTVTGLSGVNYLGVYRDYPGGLTGRLVRGVTPSYVVPLANAHSVVMPVPFYDLDGPHVYSLIVYGGGEAVGNHIACAAVVTTF